MKLNNPLKLVISVAIAEGAGIIGSAFTSPSVTDWYGGLVKPGINPPPWVFGPVWTVLFALMGLAAFLVWKKGLAQRRERMALGIYFGQLFLNVLWSALFFGLHNPGAAFVEIILLWLAILVTMFVFARITKLAAWLLVPYFIWVSFAGYLNYSIWSLNPLTAKHMAMNGLVTNIEKLSLENDNFRKVIYTDKNTQLVLMSLLPGEEIGEEIHDVDQFLRVEKGTGKAILNDIPHELADGSVIIVPAGTKHNIINTGTEAMKLYTLYMPPHHRDGVVHKTKADAEADEQEHFDGKTTE